MRNQLLTAVFLATIAGTGVAHATIILGNGDVANLGTLLAAGNDRQFVVHDKLFTIESYSSSHFNPANFNVIGFVAGTGGIPNIGFDLAGPFGDGTPGDTIVHEMNIQYTVEVLPAYYALGYRIKDTRLTFNGASTGDGSFSRVDESVFDFDTNTFLNQLSVFDVAGPPRDTRLTDGIDYLPNTYRKLEINKDIKMFAAHVNDTATASFVRQEFSQIPTPGAVSFLGMAGLVALRRRR